MNGLSPNDLRHYRTQRIAVPIGKDSAIHAKPRAGRGVAGPILRSLDGVLKTVLDTAAGGFPRALLVAATSPRADAAPSAIDLARALAGRGEQVVLVDLVRGVSTVSGPLGMPRVPGFSDLVGGGADFGEVVRLDNETALQVIASGNPATSADRSEPDRFMRVFEALTQVYGCVVLHADLPAIDAQMTDLRFELPMAVAVLPPRGTVKTEADAFSMLGSLGCPVVGYRPGSWRRRAGLFGRSTS